MNSSLLKKLLYLGIVVVIFFMILDAYTTNQAETAQPSSCRRRRYGKSIGSTWAIGNVPTPATELSYPILRGAMIN
jgi:hypothetical protein